MNASDQTRVLHLIDGLAGGGCERCLWDIVRVSDAEKLAHRIVTIQPDSGDFVYDERLRAKGAYVQPPSPRFLNFLSKHIQDLAVRKVLVPWRKCLTLTWRSAGYVLAAREVLKSFLRFRPHIIHTHGFYGFVAGLMVKAVFRKPMIHTVPCTFEQMKDAHYGWTPGLYARAQRRVDYFVTGASRAELLGLGIPASRIVSIRPAVDMQLIGAVRNVRARHYSEIRRSLGLPPEAMIALSVGRFHSSKGHLFALESVSQLLPKFPNLHWVVLGDGLQRAQLESKSVELGITDNVHLLGFQTEPLPYFAAADIYLRTPVFESENLSSTQAIAMGLPVVGFDTGCESELIDKVGHGVLVPNRNGEALTEAIAQILALPDRGRALGKRGADYSHNLDISQITAPIFESYEVLAEQRVLDE